MAVSKRLRYEILRRDNHACRYCGGVAPDVVLTVDHVTPTALGGSDAPDNLVAACKDCNSGKTSVSPDSPLVADIAQKAVEWGAAIERWNAIQSFRRDEREDYVETFDQAWHRWQYGPADDRKHVPRPPDWEVTIWQFFETGLPMEELEDAVKIACSNSKLQLDSIFRYLCGVVWKKVEKMHAGARAMVDQPPAMEDEDGEPTKDYQDGWDEGYDYFSVTDIPHRVLMNVVEGTNARYARSLRWVA
jgi:hypothetical protein